MAKANKLTGWMPGIGSVRVGPGDARTEDLGLDRAAMFKGSDDRPRIRRRRHFARAAVRLVAMAATVAAAGVGIRCGLWAAEGLPLAGAAQAGAAVGEAQGATPAVVAQAVKASLTRTADAWLPERVLLPAGSCPPVPVAAGITICVPVFARIGSGARVVQVVIQGWSPSPLPFGLLPQGLPLGGQATVISATHPSEVQAG